MTSYLRLDSVCAVARNEITIAKEEEKENDMNEKTRQQRSSSNPNVCMPSSEPKIMRATDSHCDAT
ncbi:uncharacterized protein RSE6_06985 [Rhynchosporium secalis]|uniref:Uncharacterized protein n=1 Tax=Rhynchosporium secalis TaxID=38038 RepID=A0A1E1MBQ5_RHYSE|nr:uncharacterized protein RSE6_06985 [Rhynchosporium secalis]